MLEGLIILAVVWFGWCAYTWLGNQAQADEGLLRVAMVVAMGGMFFVAISIPHAFEDEGNAAVVLAVAYAVVRFTHLGVYLIAAGDDTELRSVIFGMLGVATVMLVMLFTGAAVGGTAQQWWWLAAVVERPGRRLLRALHAMATQQRVTLRRALRADHHHRHRRVDRRGRCFHVERRASGRDALALVCGLAIAVCLWWLYFDVVAKVAEDVLRQSSGIERARLARDSYTYIHFLFVAGIVFVALGLVVLIGDHGHVDAGRYALYGGIVCYLVGHCLFRLRNVGGVNVARAVAGLVLLAGIPTLGGLSTLGQVAVPAIVLTALVIFEVRAFRAPRDAIRHRSHVSVAAAEAGEVGSPEDPWQESSS